MSVLLINPPVGNVNKPYISIPVLANFLKQQSIPVAAWDLGQEFANLFYTPLSIINGLEHLQSRFSILNNKSKLSVSEIVEYNMSIRLLSQYEQYKDAYMTKINPFIESDNVFTKEEYEFFFDLSNFIHYPECIIHSPVGPIIVLSALHTYSTRDLMRATVNKNHYYNYIERLITENPQKFEGVKVIGFSVVFQNQLRFAFIAAAIIKKQYPHIHITLGGPTISNLFRKIDNPDIFSIIDSLVFDEGELPLLRLCKAITNKNSITEIPNLVYYKDEIVNHIRDCRSENEFLTMPDYKIFDMDVYPKTSDTSPLIFRLSKGCYWQKCAFCRCDIYHCRNYFQPEVTKVVDEILDVVTDLKPKSVLFSDESVHPEILEYLCNEKIKRKIPFVWGAHSRVSKDLNAERALLYKKAGCKHFFVGVESFSDRILKLMRKGISERLINNVLNDFGDKMPLSVYLMSGFPTESKEEMAYAYQKSHQYMDENKIVSISNSFFSVAYGSEIWNNPSKYNIILPEPDSYCDLNYDILDFSYTSDRFLPRKEAYQIYMKTAVPHRLNETILKRLGIKQDLSKIQQKIIDWTFEIDKHTSLPLWLQENEEIYYER